MATKPPTRNSLFFGTQDIHGPLLRTDLTKFGHLPEVEAWNRGGFDASQKWRIHVGISINAGTPIAGFERKIPSRNGMIGVPP